MEGEGRPPYGDRREPLCVRIYLARESEREWEAHTDLPDEGATGYLRAGVPLIAAMFVKRGILVAQVDLSDVCGYNSLHGSLDCPVRLRGGSGRERF